MEGKIILSKGSTPSQIEQYFRGVLALDEQDKVFSVNLDDVWQLVYSEKGKAVRALKENFIENVDFIIIAQNGKNPQLADSQVLPKNGKNPQGGRPAVDYYLTSACLEYFVARKVRPVFEVYRRVFHHVARTVQKMSERAEDVQLKLMFAEWSARFLNLNEASKLGMAQRISEDVGMNDMLPKVINAGTEHPTIHSARELLKEHGVGISVQAFNKLLEIKGIVKTITRPGRGKKIHSWKVLQPLYDKYGQNVQDPQHQKQTQIKWYDGLFGELLRISNIAKECTLDLDNLE